MKLYSSPMSPFAARIRLAIYRKKLDIEIVSPPEGGTKSDAFLAINPMGEVPTLVLDSGVAIPDSAPIIEYLEDAFPEISLRPKKLEDLARARLFFRLPDGHFKGAPRILIGMHRNPDTRNEAMIKEAMENLNKALGYMDYYIDDSEWAVGGQASIADCALIPVLNAVTLVEKFYDQPDLISKHKKLGNYWKVAKMETIHAKVIEEQFTAARGMMPPAKAA